ncbi:MAG: hypothetical protein A2Y23_10190 [Clostridiales bacterium GWB2_37_7]|nr:MAG: hypothetical protein A2Y23_10190 [Clostridiales bacterium GWB2_37_7]
MSCKTYREMLHSYINNELNPLETKAVCEHLEVCADCSGEVSEIKKLKAVIAAVKNDKLQISGLKESILSAIKVTQKVRAAAYDIKVVGRLATSLIACGLLVFFMNFTTLGSNLEVQSDKINIDIRSMSQKITQPMATINKGLTDMSSKIVDLNGITFRIEQKIRGGM